MCWSLVGTSIGCKKNRNTHGKIFGGYIMKKAFELAYITAVSERRVRLASHCAMCGMYIIPPLFIQLLTLIFIWIFTGCISFYWTIPGMLFLSIGVLLRGKLPCLLKCRRHPIRQGTETYPLNGGTSVFRILGAYGLFLPHTPACTFVLDSMDLSLPHSLLSLALYYFPLERIHLFFFQPHNYVAHNYVS